MKSDNTVNKLTSWTPALEPLTSSITTAEDTFITTTGNRFITTAGYKLTAEMSSVPIKREIVTKPTEPPNVFNITIHDYQREEFIPQSTGFVLEDTFSFNVTNSSSLEDIIQGRYTSGALSQLPDSMFLLCFMYIWFYVL